MRTWVCGSKEGGRKPVANVLKSTKTSNTVHIVIKWEKAEKKWSKNPATLCIKRQGQVEKRWVWLTCLDLLRRYIQTSINSKSTSSIKGKVKTNHTGNSTLSRMLHHVTGTRKIKTAKKIKTRVCCISSCEKLRIINKEKKFTKLVLTKDTRVLFYSFKTLRDVVVLFFCF